MDTSDDNGRKRDHIKLYCKVVLYYERKGYRMIFINWSRMIYKIHLSITLTSEATGVFEMIHWEMNH